MKMTKCADCGKPGGRFRLCGDGKWRHTPQCGSAKVHHQKSTFPFTTNNMGDPNNGPIEVQSMRHLRQLERQHGVVSEVYNNNSDYQGGRY